MVATSTRLPFYCNPFSEVEPHTNQGRVVEQCIKFFQIILNSIFYFYLAIIEIAQKVVSWRLLSCQLATFQLKKSNLTSQNTTIFDQICQLATQKSPIVNFLSNFNFG